MGNKTKGSHEWIIEFSREPDDMKKFTEILDLSLQKAQILIMKQKDIKTSH